MNELNLTATLLTAMTDYGALALGLAALLGALGLPMPAQVLLLAGGALVRQGVVEPLDAVLAWLAGCALGDSTYYAAGRYAGDWLKCRLGKVLGNAWAAAQARFTEHAPATIFLTRWLITPLGLPTNLVAGNTRYAYGRFLALTAAGDLMWVLTYGLAGYLLGEQWPLISQVMSRYGGWACAAAIAGVGIYWLVRRRPAHGNTSPAEAMWERLKACRTDSHATTIHLARPQTGCLPDVPRLLL
jgi:membrane-associated protein